MPAPPPGPGSDIALLIRMVATGCINEPIFQACGTAGSIAPGDCGGNTAGAVVALVDQGCSFCGDAMIKLLFKLLMDDAECDRAHEERRNTESDRDERD